MLEILSQFADYWGPLNVFRYISFRSMGAGASALLFCLFFGPFIIRRLTELKIGQPIRTKEEVHRLAELHGGKKGTPTMGGVMILAAVLFSLVLWTSFNNRFVLLAVFTLVALGGIGFYDDYLKVKKRKSAGLSGRLKLMGQLLVALVVGVTLLTTPETSTHAAQLEVPFFKFSVLTLGWWMLGFFALVIMGSSNAVNLTDGLDGLAAGCCVIALMVLAVFAYISGNIIFSRHLLFPYSPGTEELTVVCAALAGATLGFLWFNCHPAQVFMGDTGSLALGGVLGTISICINQELLLLVAGGVFVMEAVSVILQVGSFKMTGRRIFAMAPIHHHFELKGWSENKVVVRFWVLGVLFACLALASLKLR